MAITANRFFSADPRTLTAEIEDRFFTDLKTRNNTFKRTASDRFRALDQSCARHFAQASSRLREVLDIGISSGSTTLALHDCLARAGQFPRITGTDLSLAGYLVPVAPGLRALVDEQGHALQYDAFGRVIRAWGRRLDYVTGMVAVRWLLHASSRRRILARLRHGGAGLREVRLLSPRLAGHSDISIERNDIFVHAPHLVGRFDFIRAANILNLGYFDEPRLARAFANVARYLSGPGAWLLVARSGGGGTAATLFRVSADGRDLLVMDRIGTGSEVERIVLATALPAWPVHA